MIRLRKTAPDKQRGVALLVVLLLVATLSIVAIAITERTTLTAARSLNARLRGEAVWLAFGAETLALGAIQQIVDNSDGKMSLDDAWAQEPLLAPVDNGVARLFLIDATTCFNVNSLASITPGTGNDQAPQGAGAGVVSSTREFALLVRNLGLNEFEGERIAEVIADWIDEDTSRRPQGAEDAYYTSLPSPYRTGNTALASVSELRGMREMSRDLYAGLKPFLCALPDRQPSPVNVNMLQARHAPLLAALLGESFTVLQAEEIIAARPPGGYAREADFVALPQLQAVADREALTSRVKVTSQYMQARAEIIYDTSVFEMTADIAVETGGNARLIARRFGAEE